MNKFVKNLELPNNCGEGIRVQVLDPILNPENIVTKNSGQQLARFDKRTDSRLMRVQDTIPMFIN